MVWRNMAEGLAKGLTGERLKYNENLSEWQKLLITYHACHEEGTGECSTMSYWGDEEAWIRFIMLQSGHGLLPRNYELVRMEYERKRSMPVWDGEPAYERMPTSWPVPESFHDEWMVRKRAYWSLLAGAFGYTYGHGCVWCMISEKEKNLLADRTWYEAMHSRGSEQMKYLREAMDSLKFGSLIPCQQLLNKQKKSAKDILNLHIQAALDRERKFLCVYFPSGGEEELVLSEFCDREEELYLWWWKPSDGKFYDKTDLPAEKPERAVSENGILKVKTPSCGEGKDWLLLVYREYTEIPIESRCYYSFDEEAKVQKVFEW